MKDILLMNLLEGLFRKKKVSILNEGELQKAYLYLLKKCQVQAVMELKKLTKIRPSKRISISAQEFLLKEGKVGGIKSIQKATGFKAKFSQKMVTGAYNKLRRVKICHLIKPYIIKELHHLTGTKASKKTISYWYDTLMKNENISGIKVIEKMTGIESKYKIEVDFLLLLRRGDFKRAKTFYEINKSKLRRKYRDIERIFERMAKAKLFDS